MQGKEDTTTVVDITVMVWYTAQFRNTFQTEEDMNVFVNLVFEETNQGYVNSQIPVSHTLQKKPKIRVLAKVDWSNGLGYCEYPNP